MTSDKKTRPFVGDPLASTYRWKLHLINGYTFDGYSKNKNMAERQDKTYLLQQCITRLLNNGYAQKCYLMEFYKCEGGNKAHDTLLLEMKSDTYVAHNQLILNLPTLAFLDRVYAALKTDEDVKDFTPFLPPAPKTVHGAEEKADFNFTTERFPRLEDAVQHCSQYLLTKYERSRVEAWYHKIKHHYTPGKQLPTNPSPVVRPASEDAATYEALAQQGIHNAKAAIATLQGKKNRW